MAIQTELKALAPDKVFNLTDAPIRDSLINNFNDKLEIYTKNKADENKYLVNTPIDTKKLKESTHIAYLLKDEYWNFSKKGLVQKDPSKTIPFSDPIAIEIQAEGEAESIKGKAFAIKYHRKAVEKTCEYGFDLDVVITDTDVTLSTPIRIDPIIGNDGGGGVSDEKNP